MVVNVNTLGAYEREDVAEWLSNITDNLLIVGVGIRGYNIGKTMRPYLENAGIEVSSIAVEPDKHNKQFGSSTTNYRPVRGIITDPKITDSPLETPKKIQIDEDLTLITDDYTISGQTIAGVMLYLAENAEFPHDGKMATFVEGDLSFVQDNKPFANFSLNEGISGDNVLKRLYELDTSGHYIHLGMRGQLPLLTENELDMLRFGQDNVTYYLMGGVNELSRSPI